MLLALDRADTKLVWKPSGSHELLVTVSGAVSGVDPVAGALLQVTPRGHR